MFLYCLICGKKYANEIGYNDHLTRKQHHINLMKLQTLYAKDPDSDAYKTWIKTRDESNGQRKTKKKDES